MTWLLAGLALWLVLVLARAARADRRQWERERARFQAQVEELRKLPAREAKTLADLVEHRGRAR